MDEIRVPLSWASMVLNPGDHICVLYSTVEELAAIVAAYLAEGLARRERCWYVPDGNETADVRAALVASGIDVAAEESRGALTLFQANDAYLARGNFEAEQTMKTFSDAIEQALTDGFSGFRAAAEMSWAARVDRGSERLIEYEALLRTLFATSRATGLCLYHRARMPLEALSGGLATHPLLHVAGEFEANPFYDVTVQRLPRSVARASISLAEFDELQARRRPRR